MAAPTSHSHLGLEADSCRDGRRRPSVSCLVVSCRGLVGANGRVRYGGKRSTTARYLCRTGPLPAMATVVCLITI